MKKHVQQTDKRNLRLHYWRHNAERWEWLADKLYKRGDTAQKQAEQAEESANAAILKAYRAGVDVMRELMKDVYRYQQNDLESPMKDIKKHLRIARLYCMDEQETAARRADAWKDVGKCISALLVLQSIETVSRLAAMKEADRNNLLWLYNADRDGAPDYINYSRPDFPAVTEEELKDAELMTPPRACNDSPLWDNADRDGGDF